MKIVLFESAEFTNLYPLTYLRPVFDLRCGALSLREKVRNKFPDCPLHLEVRPALAEVAQEFYGLRAVNNPDRLKPDDDILLVNAGAILTGPASSYGNGPRAAITREGDFIWASLPREMARKLQASSAVELATAAMREIEAQITGDILIKYPWDLVRHNGEQIAADFLAFFGPDVRTDLPEGVAILGDRANLHVAEGAQVQPLTFIDCRSGPVIIGAGAIVSAHTSIRGPAFIGPDTHLFEAAIREGTSIGPVCRVGGEVEESIIHAYSNKYHAGFLGHAYVCEWVNLGAMTTNSDLKNDYSNVSVYVNGVPTDTGMMKVGAFIGDHTKTSIGTLLNTGSVVGIMCNLVAGSGVLPKYIPSFCWYIENRISKGLGLEQSLQTARAAMARRGVELSDAMVRLIRHTEELTRADKMEKVKRDRKKAFR